MKILQNSLIAIFVWFSNPAMTLGHSPWDYATMKPRVNASNVKTTIADIDTTPCGPGDNAVPGQIKHRLKPGDDFEVTWIETIDHPAKYLIDISSQDAANDPLSTAKPAQVIVMDLNQFYNDAVMPQDMVDIQDKVQDPRTTTVEAPNPNAVYKATIKIPDDVSCDKCTLRLMQKMFDNGNLRTTVYTHCTDISIKEPGTEPIVPDAPTGFKVK